MKFGILPLKYQTDRYQGIAPESRLRKLCTLNIEEDEIHFLFQCSALPTTRVTFFQRFSDNHLEFGDDHFENQANLLKKEHIVSMGLFTESLYKERQVLCICDDHWTVWKTTLSILCLSVILYFSITLIYLHNHIHSITWGSRVKLFWYKLLRTDVCVCPRPNRYNA